jgi:hypothetical protein
MIIKIIQITTNVWIKLQQWFQTDNSTNNEWLWSKNCFSHTYINRKSNKWMTRASLCPMKLPMVLDKIVLQLRMCGRVFNLEICLKKILDAIGVLIGPWYAQNVSIFPNTFAVVSPLICVFWIQLTRTNAVFSRIALVSCFCAEIQLLGKIPKNTAKILFY